MKRCTNIEQGMMILEGKARSTMGVHQSPLINEAMYEYRTKNADRMMLSPWTLNIGYSILDI